jgi:dimethylhistidine N-methyltransferase
MLHDSSCNTSLHTETDSAVFTAASEHPNVSFTDLHPAADSFREDVLKGLTSTPKYLQAKYFYDLRGSELFEQITEQPEYYLTRTEIQILREHGTTMIQECVSAESDTIRVLELGSGASIKIRILLEQLLELGKEVIYMPLDISKEFLLESSLILLEYFPTLKIESICADFSQIFTWLQQQKLPEQMLIFFPGSTIGNFTEEYAIHFFKEMSASMKPKDSLILGTDLVKDITVLEEAYNDAAGITADFNLNLLERIRKEFGTNIPLELYQHRAVFNTDREAIEMYLQSTADHTFMLDDTTVSMKADEMIHTEYSHKFSDTKIRHLSEQGNLHLTTTWKDEKSYFAVHRLQA